MYRAVTYAALQAGISPAETAAVEALLPKLQIDFRTGGESAGEIILNGEALGNRIRTLEVNANVSAIAGKPAVRRFLIAQQRQIGKAGGVVMDGRDIGTVVFPDAELKIYITADTEVRVARRVAEMQANDSTIDAAAVRENLLTRDHQDATRADSPLTKAPDALLLDTTHLTFDNQVQQVLDLANQKMTASQ
jgi:cytidylate kinase